MGNSSRSCLTATLAVLITLVCFPSHSLWAAEPIVMAAIKSKGSPGGDYLNQLYSEAFSRLGLKYVYKHYPAKRASKMADFGRVDGETNRVFAYQKRHPNLIRVEEPVYNTGMIAIVTDPNLKLSGWDSLQDTALKVDFRDGIMIAMQNLTKRVPTKKLGSVGTASQGLEKLIAGRIDVFVDTESTLASLLLSYEFRKEKLYIAGVMEHITVHPYLHIRHKDLVPQFEAALRAIKREGLTKEFRERAMFETLFSEEGAIVYRTDGK